MATRQGEMIEALDHPILFTFAVALVVCFWLAVLTWFFKAVDLPGAASLTQHP